MSAVPKPQLDEKLRIQVHEGENAWVVIFHGAFDEDADFSGIPKDRGTLVFNFRGVTRLNSCGIRSWVNALKGLAGIRVVFVECPPIVVRQMNMVPSFVADAEVQSVIVPFLCGNCDAEKLFLLSGPALKDARARVTRKQPCMNCLQGELEFEESPDAYFAFLD